jgi:hypothetical protein
MAGFLVAYCFVRWPHSRPHADLSPDRRRMSDQMPLWIKGSETSRAAAVSVAPRLNELQGVVMSYIAGRGSRGATDEEITRDLKMNPSTARPRRIELVEMGKIRSSGRTRPTVSGRSATVWVAR